jgi:hypothetical protein
MDVEVKMNFDATQIEQAKQVFGLDRESKDRQIWFGEILSGHDGRDALPLLDRGVILRVRAKKKSGDVTLKLRGPDGCIDVPAWTERVKDLAGSEIEGDWAGRRLVSASLEVEFGEAVRDTLKAPTPPLVSDLMSTAQKKLAKELLLPIDRVTLLGPIEALKWEPEHEGDIAAEQWTVDDLQFLEISVVTESGEDPERAQRKLVERACGGGLLLDDDQEPKTTRVLRHLARKAN